MEVNFWNAVREYDRVSVPCYCSIIKKRFPQKLEGAVIIFSPPPPFFGGGGRGEGEIGMSAFRQNSVSSIIYIKCYLCSYVDGFI